MKKATNPAVLDPAQFRATVDQLEVVLPVMTPKKSVMRFDIKDLETAESWGVKTIYVRRESWEALGSPEKLRLTITRA